VGVENISSKIQQIPATRVDGFEVTNIPKKEDALNCLVLETLSL